MAAAIPEGRRLTHHAVAVVLAGIGDEYRRDDGAGLVVAAAAGERSPLRRHVLATGEPLDLLDYWDGADLAIVVDAVRSGAPPGTVHVIELLSDRPEACTSVTSTHGIGVIGVLRLADVLGKAPKRVVLVGLEGKTFGVGRGLSPAVSAAVPGAVRVVQRLATCAREGHPLVYDQTVSEALGPGR